MSYESYELKTMDHECWYENLNYNPVMNKTKTILNAWNKRSLTPLGKITVNQTLIISSLNHLFASIPSPSK